MTQGVKSFGSFLYSSVNKAGEKIKKTVESNVSMRDDDDVDDWIELVLECDSICTICFQFQDGILGQFNKEQEAFMKEQANNAEACVPPWVGKPNEAQVKEEIVNLAADRRNFVRAPPAAVDFQFDYEVSYPVALAIMAEDTALEKMRFELVPKM